jgi:threonine aldolase
VQARAAAKWGGAHDTLVDALRARGVLCTGLYKLRFVTHLDVDAAAIDRAIAEIRAALGAS